MAKLGEIMRVTGALQRIEIEAKSVGISKALISGRISWVTTCISCCREEKMRWPDTVPTSVMMKTLGKKGWGHQKRTNVWLCPKCSDIVAKQEREERKKKLRNPMLNAFEQGADGMIDIVPKGAKMSKESLKGGASTATAIGGNSGSAPAPMKTLSANPKLERKIFELLQLHFDEKTRIYEKEWSDVRISQESGASPQFVSAKRIGWFGEIAEDPAITALREDIELFELDLSEKWQQIETIMATMRSKLSELNSRLPPRIK